MIDALQNHCDIFLKMVTIHFYFSPKILLFSTCSSSKLKIQSHIIVLQ